MCGAAVEIQEAGVEWKGTCGPVKVKDDDGRS